jgi:hemophore-related protein
MKSTASTVRRYLLAACAASALGAAGVANIVAPVAIAAPAPCTAAGLATTVSSVTAGAGQYLDAHPDANDALTQAGSQSPEDAKASIRTYFLGHSDEFFALQNIARPLTDLRAQCNSNVGAGQISALLQAFGQ